MRKLILFLSFIILVSAIPAEASGYTAFMSDMAPYQGDTLLVSFKGTAKPISGTFMGKPLTFLIIKFSNGGCSNSRIAKAGRYQLWVTFDTKEVFMRTVTVRARKFVKIVLGIPKELGLTDTQLVTKLGEQKVSIDATVKAETPKVYFEKAFGMPLYDNSKKITSTFGEIRQTGNSVIRHWGIDLKGERGRVCWGDEGGVIRSTYFDTVYGNTIILDHGEGIYSLYMHLQKIKVKEGDWWSVEM